MEEIPGNRELGIKKRSFGLLLQSMKHELARCDAGGVGKNHSLLSWLLFSGRHITILS